MSNPGLAAAPEQSSAASSVADRLAQVILGELAPGARLPSEADLAGQYDVSRLTIREAVKMLEGRGLLEIARGRKAVVREPSGAAFSDFLTSVIRNDPHGLYDLLQVRMALEVQSATMAAKHASRAAILAIEHTLDGMRACLAAGETLDETQELAFQSFDIGFHEAIAMAGGNRVLAYLFEAMSSTLREGFTISRRGHRQRGESLHDTVAGHQKILDCIRAGNSRAAADAMRNHLRETELDLRFALKQGRPAQTPKE